MGLLPFLPPLGEALFNPYKIPSSSCLSDLLHVPKHHLLIDLQNPEIGRLGSKNVLSNGEVTMQI